MVSLMLIHNPNPIQTPAILISNYPITLLCILDPMSSIKMESSINHHMSLLTHINSCTHPHPISHLLYIPPYPISLLLSSCRIYCNSSLLIHSCSLVINALSTQIPNASQIIYHLNISSY